MNQQMLFKKLALSALLVSAVAAPAVTNAANGAQEGTAKTTAASGAFTPVSKLAAIDWADPLKLAKTYAPNTLEDWKKALDEYHKAGGFSITTATELVASPVEGVKLSLENLSIESMPAVNIEAGSSAEIPGLPEFSEVSTIPGLPVAEGSIPTSIKGLATVSAAPVLELSEADKVFFKAQEDLNSAAKSKDATAIKEALAKLLVQYKEKIKDLETAK
jgi:hypothetical protein